MTDKEILAIQVKLESCFNAVCDDLHLEPYAFAWRNENFDDVDDAINLALLSLNESWKHKCMIPPPKAFAPYLESIKQRKRVEAARPMADVGIPWKIAKSNIAFYRLIMGLFQLRRELSSGSAEHDKVDWSGWTENCLGYWQRRKAIEAQLEPAPEAQLSIEVFIESIRNICPELAVLVENELRGAEKAPF